MEVKVNIQDLNITEGWKEWFETFSFILNYRHKKLDKDIENTLLEFLYRDDLVISEIGHRLRFVSKNTRVSAELWTSNKFYAYASYGSLKVDYPRGDSEVVSFDDSCPSKKPRVRLWAIEKAYTAHIYNVTESVKREQKNNRLSIIKEALKGA